MRTDRMIPLRAMEPAERDGVRVVFTDLDDTLTTDGRLTAATYRAMWDLEEAGVRLVVVTGRPVGWGDLVMRLWPVDGVVAENGACIYRLDESGRARRWYALGEDERRRNRRALDDLGARIVEQVDGLSLAADQAFRETDLAIDICEDVPDLDEEQMDRLFALLDEPGLKFKVSSIHVNAWYGAYDKASTCRRYLDESLPGVHEALFIGDSPNDEPLFEAFPLSVGVRNIERYADKMENPPVFVTQAHGGAGFVELVEALLR